MWIREQNYETHESQNLEISPTAIFFNLKLSWYCPNFAEIIWYYTTLSEISWTYEIDITEVTWTSF